MLGSPTPVTPDAGSMPAEAGVPPKKFLLVTDVPVPSGPFCGMAPLFVSQ